MKHRDDGEWLTLGEAARFLGVAQSTIRKWSDQARVPAFYTPGGHRRFRRADLEAFLSRSGRRGRREEGPLVLIVDDEERVRELVRANLELEGYAVAEAGSAEAALTAMERARPDLVLVDVMMPPGEGWELVRVIQERYGAGAVPMVTFSSKPLEGVPFGLQQLLDQAKRLLQ